MTLPRPALCLVAMTLLGAGPASAAGDFDRFFASGVRLYKSMDFERALDQFRLARAQPQTADENARLSFYEGILLFELGKDEEALEAFRSGLSVNPEAALPVAVSPRIQSAFAAEREKIRKLAPPKPELEPEPVPDARPAPQVIKVVPVQDGDSDLATATTPFVHSQPAPHSKVFPAIVTGLGAAAAVAGAVSLGVAWSKHADYANAQLTREEARSADLTAKVGVGVAVAGGVLLATGVVLFTLPDGTTATAAAAPLPSGALAALTFVVP